MTPFCIHCERFMNPRPHVHRVVTTSGPIWSGQYFQCPSCNSAIVAEWKSNSEPERIHSRDDELRLRRKYFPYFYIERSK